MSVTTTSTDTAGSVTPDLAAVKAKQQQTWSSGDFHVIAALIQPTADQLVDAADLQAGMRVLDVATGSGNAAIAAARLGCTVEGVDYVPALLERGRLRAAAEGFDITFVEGDAEALPYADGEATPAGGGTCRPTVFKSWPMNPSGVQLATATVPPDRVTRSSSAAAFWWSGANIEPKIVVTASNSPSA